MSNPEGINPKDIIGATKVDLSLLPGPAEIEWARAQMDGVKKYGAYNWRVKGKPVQAMTYAAAAKRHIQSFIDGEDVDPKSLCLHLGHAMACCAILIDAKACDNMVDNRPPPAPTAQMLQKYETRLDTPAAVKTLEQAFPYKKGERDPTPSKSEKWEDHLDRLINQSLNAYPPGATMQTVRLSEIIHEAWKKEANEITGREPIEDALRELKERHPQYDCANGRWVSLGPNASGRPTT